MIIDMTELQAINSFSRLESLKGVYGLIWLKISAGVQQRIGPEYAGPLGILQALADGTKLLFKEDLLPSRGDIFLFSLGPSIAVISILLSYSVIPFGYRLVLADLSLVVFLWISIASIAPIGLLMSGYGSNNKYSFLGGLRAAAQSISYEIPLTPCVLSISLRAIRRGIEAQSKYGFWGWNLWRQPIGFAVFVIFSLAECERLPFDLPEAEEELVAGYQTEYSVLYLGGWNLSLPYIFLSHFEINEVGGRFRGRIHFEFDKCIACEVCVRVCPIDLPVVDWKLETDIRKKPLLNYSIDFGICIFCGNCVEYCPTNCLSMTEEYELSTYDLIGDYTIRTIMNSTQIKKATGKLLDSRTITDY
ncbi:hypothetical protein MKW94_015568 [Papaver nudicaule]|uniref:4Fe-4S ferredoxin-type domain-containing protein n=1 Tax=Papaver nudicaule TaxID=74823 RepID=A0AA41S8W9_PAPNU|nr:hypothetical protein [Papaver nudicaule]